MDKNGDDAIEREEVRTTAEQLGFEEDAIDSFATGDFDQSDMNNDGKLNIQEVSIIIEEATQLLIGLINDLYSIELYT